MINSQIKKIRNLVVALLVLGGLFYFSNVNYTTTASLEQTTIAFEEPKLTALTPHDAIEISSDSDPDLAALPGDGSSSNPYIIENYNIEVTNNTGISIHDTTHFYIIRNCYVSADQYGISIYTRVNGNTTIEDCIVTDNFYCGIYVHDEYFTTIENCTIYNNWGYGIYANAAAGTKITENKLHDNNNIAIYVYNTDGTEVSFNDCWNNNKDNVHVKLSDFCNIYNNTVFDGPNKGFIFEYCYDSNFVANTAYNVSFGMWIDESDEAVIAGNNIYEATNDGLIAWDCNNSLIENNKISDNTQYGMDIGCPYSTIRFNTFTNDGLYISASSVSEYLTYTVEGNTANGKSIGYFINQVSATFDTPIYGQLILINCNDTNVFNQEFYQTDIGLFLYECKDTLVNGSDMSHSLLGMDVVNCNNTFTEYNTFNYNYLRGIDIISSTYTYVIYSDLNFNELGVDAYYSPNTTINNNFIIGNKLDGVYLVDSPYSRVMGNHVEENGIIGLSGTPWGGIEMENSDNSNVTHNNLILNGIIIEESSLAEYQSYNLSYNSVNGLPFGFFVDEVGVSINSPSYGQLFLVNCSDSTLSDLTFNFASIGIKLAYCNHTSISSVSSVNGLYGIELVYSDDTHISSSIFNENYIGLYAQNCYILEVHNCDFQYNSFDGCTLSYVSNSTFTDNEIAFNDFNGIQLAWGEYNLFTLNLFQQNYNYGLKLAYSDYNTIHYNTFFENNLAGYNDGMFTGYAQGYDTKTTNIWYHDVNLEGNYWTDWSGTGSYILDGRMIGPNEDLYPLGAPTVPIISEYRKTILMFIPIVIIPIIRRYIKRKKKQ